jgi:asparagine synthase (glutamine-hydrolysing)
LLDESFAAPPMSGIVAIVGTDRRIADDASLATMLGGIASRGDRSEIWRTGDSVLAVARYEWELGDGFSGEVLVANDGDVSVAADASLYYRDDLLRSLDAAGVRPSGRSPAKLIAAAYRAWGVDCAVHLEGDFAFVVYDHTNRRVFAARDIMGRRPLYYAELGGTLLIASTVSAIVAHPSCPADLDLVALAEIVSGSLAGHASTPYAAVHALPPATTLVREREAPSRTSQYWQLEINEDASDESFDSAAERLRSLLEGAITERCASTASTAIWLSGGYDSPVVFGIGNAALDQVGKPRLRPISFSYPVGDPGREDELIHEIAKFWSAQPKWLGIDDVPLLRDAAANAARADVPFQHAFENWLRALAVATHEMGSRVALQGDGGDQLFAVSTIFLRDLFSSLRWSELRREWRAFGGAGARELWRAVARPALAEQRRARRGLSAPSIALPGWMNSEFVRRHALDRRQADAEAVLAAGGGEAATETRRSLLNPVTPRVSAGMSAFGLDTGVEIRAPLLDQRIVEFARRRPRSERASRGAVKHLLRRAASDLLPPGVLTPRSQRTGTLTGYFARGFRSDSNGIVTDAFSHSRLAEAGIVDGAAMQQAWHEYKSHGSGGGGHLYMAFQTEMWLRARELTPVKLPALQGEWIRVPAAGFLQ